jgi:hypothetical protein
MASPANHHASRALLDRYHRAMLQKDADALAELYADFIHQAGQRASPRGG